MRLQADERTGAGADRPTTEVFVARHPVFDQQKETFGYELEFRSGFEHYYEALGAEKSAVDLMAFVNFGELTDGKRGFVNFTRDLLLLEFPLLFPGESMIAGIPAGMAPDGEVLARCRDLRRFGYSLALKDFVAGDLDSPLLEFAEIAEVDFAVTPPDERTAICRELARRGIQALARSVQRPEEFDQAISWGYSFFHGDFFNRPVIRPDRKITPSKLACFRLIQEVHSPELSYDQIAELIERDVSMTYRLLRFMNSAWFGLRFEVRSVKHALVLLGPEEIRKWASLMAVAGAGDDKPQELLLRSLTRAKAAEEIARLAGMDKRASEFFLMGMFSLIDALLDRPLHEILAELPLKEDIKKALQGSPGAFRSVLDTAVSYERGEWGPFAAAAASLHLREEAVPPLFRSAVKWAGEALREA